MHNHITFKPFGEKAILVEWESVISEEIINQIIIFKRKIEHQKNKLYADLIIGYNSLTIIYCKHISDFLEEVEGLKTIYNSGDIIAVQLTYIWQIPVCYELEFGIDLEEISTKLQLSTKKIIQLHSNSTYTVFFIGFLPGFLYLGGLNEQLFVDRKTTPRLKVAKGSVAIGGKQTGVYPSESPGGWHIIGKSPLEFFDIKNSTPCFAKPGDKIKFIPISLSKFYQIEKEIANNKYQISKILSND